MNTINENVLTREETVNLLSSELANNKRIVISRYNDGESILIRKISNVANEDCEILSPLLSGAIKKPNQLVCINYLKPHNISGDRWYNTQNHLKEISNLKLYGCTAWNTHDLTNGSKILPYFFKNKTLILSPFEEEIKKCLLPLNSKIDIIKTEFRLASHYYEDYKNTLLNSNKDYNNIIFCCGPIGKVLLSDMIDIFPNTNLIDIGSLINAILNEYSVNKNLVNLWPMSWFHNTESNSHVSLLLNKIKEINE